MIVDEIRTFLKDYFDVLQNQNLTLFDKVFHASCVLYSYQDGSFVARPFAEYRAMVQARQSPEAGKFPRKDEVLSIDVMSPETALVKVRLRLFDNIMMDYLNLLKVDGHWSIVAKIFYRAETLKP